MSVGDYSRVFSSPPTTSNHFVRWQPPLSGFVKLNFDGSIKNSSAAGGFILRKWTGKLLKVEASSYGKISVLVAEAGALRDRVSSVIQAGFKRIVIKGDNQIETQALRGNIHIPWKTFARG